jgi:hypothetical protein
MRDQYLVPIRGPYQTRRPYRRAPRQEPHQDGEDARQTDQPYNDAPAQRSSPIGSLSVPTLPPAAPRIAATEFSPLPRLVIRPAGAALRKKPSI